MIGALPAIVGVVLIVAWLRPLARYGLRALHLLQLEEYQTARYWRWLAGHPGAPFDRFLWPSTVIVAGATVLLPGPTWLLAPVVGAVVGVWRSVTEKPNEAKKPLVLTARARRLLAGWIFCSLVVALVLLSLVLLNGGTTKPVTLGFAAAIALLGVAALTWPLMSVANLLLYPVEANFRNYYLRSARTILKKFQPVVVGVAGSYGKTSTKTILAQILSTRYPTLATPRSFNTPMGLCRVIREQLRPEHRFFIAELGAYQRGEIRELCRLVEPSIGILTTVGPEHLERFGSMENVRKAEFELIEALPSDGLAIFNGDDPACVAMSEKARCRVIVTGPETEANRKIWADDIRLTTAGLEFTLNTADGCRGTVTTPLLGRHNVANILVASAAAIACGLTFDDLLAAIPRLEPVEHRLQLIPNPNGVVVIDDTYNSNPRGAAAALETLAAFQGGRRYLVTPGMVELAGLQDEAHREFGQRAAGVCDAVILVGPKQTRAIAEGLSEAGFARDRVIVARNLAEATEHLKDLLHAGDAVLFENDLPDNYAE